MNRSDSVIIKRLQSHELDEFIKLIRLFEDVFEMKNFTIPSYTHLQKLLDRYEFNVFVASVENKVVGGLTTYIMEQYYSKKPLAYIFDLAVETNLQRLGIGKKLIEATKKFYKEHGFEEVFVQADRAEEYAVEFYRKTNPSEEEQVVHFYYTLNK